MDDAARIHPTIPIQVWVDIDIGIADAVSFLNHIPGVRTHASCQGTIGEGGAEPYRPHVLATWTDEALPMLQEKFEIEVLGENFGELYPLCDLWESSAPDDSDVSVIFYKSLEFLTSLTAVAEYLRWSARDVERGEIHPDDLLHFVKVAITALDKLQNPIAQVNGCNP